MKTSISAIHSPGDLAAHIETKLRGTGLLIVGVCGMAGAGKSTLCNQVAETACFGTVRLDCDRFASHSLSERQALIDEATRSGNPERIGFIENPQNWYAFGDIISALGDLKTHGIHTFSRAWNRQTGELNGLYELTVPTGGPAVVLCDGIYLLHPVIRKEMDLVVLVETPEEIVARRGLQRSAGNVARAAYMESLHRKYSVPYFETFGNQADIVYRGHVHAS